MHHADAYANDGTTFSFEFFPPKTEKSAESLFRSVAELEELRPDFVSVTYGAGGGTRDLTQKVVMRIRNETSLTVMPHLTCVCHTEAEIYDVLEDYARSGIENILCLGGDPPKHLDNHDRQRDAFRYAADLVRFTKQFNELQGGKTIKDPRGFGIAVAGFPEGHPATPNRLAEMDHLKAKVDAGADVIVTQLFFDNRDFYDFRERCEMAGIHIPIVAGIMPITSASGMKKMADLAGGSRFPAPLLRSIDRAVAAYPDPDAKEAKEAVKRVGVHWATEQCRDLLDHQVRGIHFYTLNRSTATREIYKTLGVQHSEALVV